MVNPTPLRSNSPLMVWVPVAVLSLSAAGSNALPERLRKNRRRQSQMKLPLVSFTPANWPLLTGEAGSMDPFNGALPTAGFPHLGSGGHIQKVLPQYPGPIEKP